MKRRWKYEGFTGLSAGWGSPYFARMVLSLIVATVVIGVVVYGVFDSFLRFLNDEFVVMTTESMSDYTLAQKVEVESSIHETHAVLSAMRALAESDDIDPQGEKYAKYLQTWNDKGLFRVVYSSVDELKAGSFSASDQKDEDAVILERLEAGQSVVSDVRFSSRYDGYYYSVAEPVTRDGRVVGALRSIIEADTLLQTSQEDSQVTLIASLLVKSDGTVVPVRSATGGLEGANLFDLLGERGCAPEVVAQARADMENDSVVTTTVISPLGFVTTFFTVAPLGFNDWNIVNFTEESDLAQHAENILKGTVRTGGYLVAVSAIACLIVVLVVNGIRRRARRDAERYAVLAEFSDTVLLEYSYASDLLELTPNARDVFQLDELSAHHYLERGQSLIDVHEGDYGLLVEALEHPCPNEARTVACRVRSVSKEYRWFSFTFRYLYEGSQPYRAVVKIVDIDDQRKKEERLERRLRIDGLTGILNKVAVRDEVEAALRSGKPGALFVIDVDDFKQVNDSYGHSVGDRALSTVARILSDVFGSRGFVGRVGGDEFVAFVPLLKGSSDARDLQASLELRALAASAEMGFDLGMSVGAAFFPADGKSYQELFDAADNAMYEDKRDKGSL